MYFCIIFAPLIAGCSALRNKVDILRVKDIDMPQVQIINMQEKSRVIECVAVCGIDPELENSIDITQCIEVEFRAITGLELVSEPAYDSQKDKYIEINNRLYLRVVFDRNRPPISEIEFFTPEIADNSKINDGTWTPVFIRSQDRTSKTGDYNANSVNIRAYLDSKQNQQQALVLCYRSDENCEMAICDIEVLQGDKREGRRSQQQKEILNVPHEYKTVNHAFVIRNRNKYLIYRRMHSKLDSTYKPTIMEVYPPKRTNRDMSLESLPSFCFPEGIRLSEQERGFISFSFVLTLQTLQRIYCSCLIFKEQLPKHVVRKLGFKKDRPYYCEKALCIVSEYCYPDQYCELLQQIYRIGMSKNDVPFYKVVQNLVDDMEMIDPEEWGKVALRYTYGGCKIILETRARFPVVSDKSIYCLFKFLQVDKIISVFESMLLEKKILLISQSKTVLGLVCEALMCIIFPFKWQQTIIPVLPLSMRQYTQAPVPFIIGIPPNFSDIEYEKECIIVDLDNNQIVNDEALPPMPDKMVKQLQKRIVEYEVYVRQHTKQYLQNPENRYIFEMLQQADSDNVNFDPYDIRDAFFEFMLTLMKNYMKFWKKGKKQAAYKETSTLGLDPAAKSMDQLYNTQDFLGDLNMTKIGSFGYKFTETSIFSNFIETRARQPKNLYYLFFEECLEKKKAKKDAKFIVYSKIEKFWDCPSPSWPTQPGVYFSYQKIPSILSPKQDINKMGQQQIDIEIEPNSERFRQGNRRQRAFLDERCLIYRGFYTSGTAYGLPKQLMQLDISEDLRDIIVKLFMKDEVAFISELISKSLGGSSKAANESAVLSILVDKFMEQQKFMERMIRGWDLTQKQPRYRIQIISTVAMPMKTLAQKQQDRQIITAEQIYEDFQSISFQKTNIVFYPTQTHADMKRIYIKIDNSAMKHILNNILHKQLESFTRFVLQKYSTCDILMWTCEELRKFRKWLS